MRTILKSSDERQRMEHALKELTLEIKPSRIVEGEVGLFAARDIRAGELVMQLAESEEDFISEEELRVLSPALQEKVRAFSGGVEGGGYLIDAGIDYNELPISYFLNHSCEGNLGYGAGYELVAMRDIKKGEELCYDYGIAESNPDFILECRCGSDACRGTVTGNDWQDPGFKEKLGAYFYPDLRAV